MSMCSAADLARPAWRLYRRGWWVWLSLQRRAGLRLEVLPRRSPFEGRRSCLLRLRTHRPAIRSVSDQAATPAADGACSPAAWSARRLR